MKQLSQSNHTYATLLLVLAGAALFLFSTLSNESITVPRGTLVLDTPQARVNFVDCSQVGTDMSIQHCYGDGWGSTEATCAQEAIVDCTNQCSNIMGWYLNSPGQASKCNNWCSQNAPQCPTGIVHATNVHACVIDGPIGQGNESYTCYAQGDFTVRCSCT